MNQNVLESLKEQVAAMMSCQCEGCGQSLEELADAVAEYAIRMEGLEPVRRPSLKLITGGR